MASIATIEVTDGNPVAALRGFCARLLESGEVTAVLAPRTLPGGFGTMPALIAETEGLADVDPLAPSFRINAARMLTRLTRVRRQHHGRRPAAPLRGARLHRCCAS